MPHGDTYIAQQPDVRGNYARGAKLVDNWPYVATATFVGPWVDISTLKAATVHVEGTFTGTVNIEGTNKDNPVAGDAGVALVTALTSAGLVALTKMPVRYVRANLSGFSNGSVNVQLHGVS